MRKIRKFYWLLLAAFTLTLILAPSSLVLGQTPDKFSLMLNLQPWNYSDGLTPGQVNTLYLEVRNNSNTVINNIRFGSSAPPNWKVNFTPASLDSLSSGSGTTVNVDVIPPADIGGRGNYNITLIADANETRAVTTAFLTVRSGSTYWIWIGIGVGVVAAAIFVFIYLKFGRG
jgi:uncharacterized membrane protein